MKVLDPCCGSRMMYFDRHHPAVVFGDRRCETLAVTDRSHGKTEGTRVLRIEPDVQLDFRALPYADGTFPLVDGIPAHVGRLRAYGNAIVVPQAVEFVKAMMDVI